MDYTLLQLSKKILISHLKTSYIINYFSFVFTTETSNRILSTTNFIAKPVYVNDIEYSELKFVWLACVGSPSIQNRVERKTLKYNRYACLELEFLSLLWNRALSLCCILQLKFQYV